MHEDERIIRERERLSNERAALRRERVKLRRWWRDTQEKLTPPAPTKKGGGFPTGILKYILWNMLFWVIGVGFLYMAVGGNVVQVWQLMIGLVLLLALVLGYQLLMWRFYWWFVAIQWTCANLIILFAIFAIASGMTINSIGRLFLW